MSDILKQKLQEAGKWHKNPTHNTQ
jgi:hypothetical protein